MSDAKMESRQRLIAELTKTFFVFVYLTLFLSAFTTYRRLILAEYQIRFFHYGYSIMEALVLSKIIVFGSMFRLGESFSNRPLIVATLYKTLCFSLLILMMAILEHLIIGWWHGLSTGAIIEAIRNENIWEILARVFVKFLALIPLFAMWELGRVLGDRRLFELFFTRGDAALAPTVSTDRP